MLSLERLRILEQLCVDFLKELLIRSRSALVTNTVGIKKKNASFHLPVWFDFYDFSNSYRLILFITRLELCHCYVMLTAEFIYRYPWLAILNRFLTTSQFCSFSSPFIMHNFALPFCFR